MGGSVVPLGCSGPDLERQWNYHQRLCRVGGFRGEESLGVACFMRIRAQQLKDTKVFGLI